MTAIPVSRATSTLIETRTADAGETFDPRTPADRFMRAKGELDQQDAQMRRRLTADQYTAWRTAEDARLADAAALDAQEAQETAPPSK